MPSTSAASGPFSAGTTIASAPSRARSLGDREDAGDRPHRAVEGELADQRDPRSGWPLELPRRGQQRRRDRQVEAGAGLAQAGRSEVGDDPAQRELEAAVGERRPHPLARLAHGGVGQADDREGRQSPVDVDLDPDRARRDPVEGEGLGRGEHGDQPRSAGSAGGAQTVPTFPCSRGETRAAPARTVAVDDAPPASSTGRAAEDLVASPPRRRRLGAVERNARTRFGELDIVALDGRALVFVEVKAGRAGADFGPERPVHAIGPRKQRRIRRLATAWIAERRGGIHRYEEIRFDAVGVTFDRAGKVAEYEHLKNAF